MERYRLKNIIILILLLVNVSLMSSLFYRQAEKHTMMQRTEDELISLFSAYDITLSPGTISWKTPPGEISMSRSAELEQELAAFLLGSDFRSAAQGGINIYSSASASLQTRTNGEFDAVFYHAPEDTGAFCKELCALLSCSAPTFSLDEQGNGSASAVCQYENQPVYNAAVTFTLENGLITAVSGMLLPADGISRTTGEELSCPAALTAFLDMLLEEGTVGSSILNTYVCYELQRTPASAISLNSVWCIETDVSNYYVNSMTGTITVG